MRVALCAALCGALVFSVGCSQGVSAADADALSLGMTVSEMEAEVGSEFVVSGEPVILGSTITVGYHRLERDVDARLDVGTELLAFLRREAHSRTILRRSLHSGHHMLLTWPRLRCCPRWRVTR